MPDIRKVLIANRGEIALRILRTLDRMNVPGVVVYHPADARSPAVKEAPETVQIEGPSPVQAYLDAEALITACRRTGADAVHPGFGFLAENAGFARRLSEEGITFIGPGPEAMELMGNKAGARAFCITHGFPVAPSVTEADAGTNFLEAARELGPPLLIKAVSGGGGKGMHIVQTLEDLEEAVELARSEAFRSFGDGALYAERYLENPRHIEVQVFGDARGRVLHLGERECSVQRRFQKIIEESPAPGLSPELRGRICETAVEIARKAGYINAGTVEFLLAPSGKFYFLEMNTRIQVEHPVTEMVTGIDLVELQVRVARGEPLPFSQDEIRFEGHAVEARLYAEDPESDFIPATGRLLAYRMPEEAGIRVENGYEEGMHVTAEFDPMLAKIIAHGADREEAIGRAIKALEASVVLGVTTNQDFLVRVLRHPAFRAGEVDTGFIARHREDLNAPSLTSTERNLLLAAAALATRDLVDPAFTVPEPYASMGSWRN